MQTVNLTDAKARLSELVSAVADTQDRVEITRNGKPAAILISHEDLFTLEETIAVLSDPELVASIAESEAEITRGEPGFSPEEIREMLEARRSSRWITNAE